MKKTVWSARVHTSGEKVQLLKNGSVTKVIRASDATFTKDNAKKFAHSLIEKLNTKVAKQMTDPSAKPSIDSKGEQHSKSMDVLTENAKGISPKEASLSAENKSLRKKIARLEKDAATERKARRGLAIAKGLVDLNKLANDPEAIKEQVMKVIAMTNDEIGLLERKVAGQPLYDTAEDALKASRRYARMARLHLQAAEDAQLAGDDELADEEDFKASRCTDLSKEAANVATDPSYGQFSSGVDSLAKDDAANQAGDQPKGVDAKGNKTASDDDIDDVEDDVEDDDVEDDVEDEYEDEFIEEDNYTDDEDDIDVVAAATIYRKIASDHRLKAKSLTKEGKEKEAMTENEIADEAEQLAESVESSVKTANVDYEFTKEAASIYRKIAEDHRKKANELEAEGKTAEADEEDEIADEAEQLASSIETSLSDDEAKDTSSYNKEADTDDVEDTDDSFDQEATDEMIDDADIDKDATNKANDPLASLINESEESEEDEIADDEMPSDDMIKAALANEDYNVDEDEESTSDDDLDSETKEAGNKSTKKVANYGYSHDVNFDRIEQNPMSGKSQVKELESLWD